MRIAIVTPMPLREPIQGGVQSHVANLAATLAAGGHELTVVSMGHRSDSVLGYGVSIRNVQGWSPVGDVLAARRAIDTLDPDIVHLHTVSPKVLLLAVLVQRRHPTALTVHGLPAEEWRYMDGLERYVKRFVGGPAQRHLVPRVRNRIVVSQYVADQFDVPTHVVPNGVEERFFDVEPGEFPVSEPRLLTVGTVQPRKGLGDAVLALAELRESIPDAHLDVVGATGDPEYRAALESRVDELGLSEAVTFHGSVDADRLRTLYGSAAVFVFPSREESQGIVVLEAMATGTPVVGSDAAAVPDIVEDNDAGLVYPVGDAAALASSLETLLGDEGRYRQYQQSCRENAARYRWSAVRADLLAVYEQIQ